jgi:UDP-glucuronate decarboxylase
MSKIFVSGGAGFIGTHIIKRFSKDNQIVSYGDISRNSAKFFIDEINQKNVVYDVGDILDFNKLDFSIRGSDIAIHCAAIAGVSNYFKRPADTAVVNGIGTFNILEACRKNDVKKVIILSSSEVYGDSEHNDEVDGTSEFTSVHNLRLTYSISKLFSDQLAIAYHKQYEMDICSIRPFGIFGEGQVGEGAIQIFCRKAINNEDIPVVGNGLQRRDWCYVDDFVDAVELCMNSDKISGQILNIGNPANYMDIECLAKKIIKLSNSKSKITFVNRDNVRDTQYRESNVGLAEKLINFKNKTPFDEALLNPTVGENITF